MKIAVNKTNLTIAGVIAGHSEWTLSDKTGECAEMDWSHPEKEVIKYLEYNTVRKYNISSTISKITQCKVKRSNASIMIHHVTNLPTSFQQQDNQQE